MAQQYSSLTMPSSQSADPVISGTAEQSTALVPTSALATKVASTSTGPPSAPLQTAAAHTHQSMALIPASSPTHRDLVAVNASSSGMAAAPGQHPQSSMPYNLREGDEAWSVVTRALMVAVMGSQPPATAANTLLGVFRPMVDGWATAQKEGKRWKERAEVYMAEHHKHKMEHAYKHDSLQAQVESLKQSLVESQSRVRESESQHSTFRANVSSLEKKLGDAEAQARATKESHAQAAQESRKEVEAMAKSAQEAKLMYEKLRQEADNKTRAQNAEIAKLQEKIKESDAMKAKLDERLGATLAKVTSLETELSQKGQEITNLQTRVTELTTRKEALERQLGLYQRLPTRRF